MTTTFSCKSKVNISFIYFSALWLMVDLIQVGEAKKRLSCLTSSPMSPLDSQDRDGESQEGLKKSNRYAMNSKSKIIYSSIFCNPSFLKVWLHLQNCPHWRRSKWVCFKKWSLNHVHCCRLLGRPLWWGGTWTTPSTRRRWQPSGSTSPSRRWSWTEALWSFRSGEVEPILV